jgi:hypothetical protein
MIIKVTTHTQPTTLGRLIASAELAVNVGEHLKTLPQLETLATNSASHTTAAVASKNHGRGHPIVRTFVVCVFHVSPSSASSHARRWSVKTERKEEHERYQFTTLGGYLRMWKACDRGERNNCIVVLIYYTPCCRSILFL